MKVYACPEEVPVPAVDYKNYDTKTDRANAAAHTKKLAAWLKANGFPGKNTGRILRVPYADGYAEYIVRRWLQVVPDPSTLWRWMGFPGCSIPA
jgi:hypothetical protein